MIWVIANKAEEDGSFPTYRYYKEAFCKGEIDIYCAGQDDDFSFIGKEDVAIIRTRDENINNRMAESQMKTGFISTLESPLTNHLTHDKNAVKSVLRENGIPFPETVDICNLTGEGTYFVKPLYGENSIGVDSRSICRTKEEVVKKYDSLLKTGLRPIIEEYIEGFDVTASVFKIKKNDSLEVYAVVTESNDCHNLQSEDTKKGFSFTAIRYHNAAVDIIARNVFKAVGANHCLRIDFRIAQDVPYVIDVNMIPGLAPDGYMSMCMKEHGIGYHDFIRMMVNTAS